MGKLGSLLVKRSCFLFCFGYLFFLTRTPPTHTIIYPAGVVHRARAGSTIAMALVLLALGRVWSLPVFGVDVGVVLGAVAVGR